MFFSLVFFVVLLHQLVFLQQLISVPMQQLKIMLPSFHSHSRKFPVLLQSRSHPSHQSSCGSGRLNFQGSFVEWLYMDHKFASYELQTRAIPLGPSAVSFSMTIWSAIDLKGVGGMGYCVPLQHPRTLAFS